ncbi:BamA/TamA family outer membrane protein [Pedobacter sp.]|uniref:translocation and assembly module lipoprotein TamL n=1 Tax=Pedobacter sp. TaxID=1411316 RepID=UPI003D7FA798
MRQRIRTSLFLLGILILSACSNTRHLKPGQNLYLGAEVKINPDSSVRIDNQKDVKNTLLTKTRPRPNKKILGIRFKLGVYNLAGEPKKPKGIRNWLRNKVGEPPVLLSDVNLTYNNAVLSSYLISQGYLQAVSIGDTVVKRKRAKAIYTVNTGNRYIINSVTFPKDSVGIPHIINQHLDKTLLKVGDYYDLDVFKRERERIDNDLKEAGYFYFSPDYLILQVDSSIGKHRVDIALKVKDIAPAASLKPYTINEINIYPNYSLQRDSMLRKLTPEVYNGFNIYTRRQIFKPKLFDRLVFFKKGELYNRRDHNQSLNRMVNIGAFQYVNAEFVPLDSFKNHELDLNIYLTPLKKKSLSFSATGTSKSNNFVGSEIMLTQTTRNLFGGAEQLDLSVSGGFETQVSGQSQALNSSSLTATGKLTFPQFIVPFFKPSNTNTYIPKTVASLSYQLLNRASNYNLNSFKGEFGYTWNENQYKLHTLNPVSVNFVTSKITAKNPDSLLAAIPDLRRVLEKQFIIGSNYNFTYSNQMDDNRRNNMYFFGGLETGGNVWGLFARKNAEGQKVIAGVPINQFVRVELDFRDYFKITRNVIWANRLNFGYGYAYGNSTSLPFVRQFFAGGSNDIRAFPARSLGPGTYRVPSRESYADQSGDVKAMFNTELRFKLVSVLHGALFADAGNVWLRKEDPTRPGSGFEFKTALSEMAVGTGAGLRVDATIFIIRLDVAFPIRKPYLAPGERWVIDEVDFGSKTWRKDNLIYNIGIGYPF